MRWRVEAYVSVERAKVKGIGGAGRVWKVVGEYGNATVAERQMRNVMVDHVGEPLRIRNCHNFAIRREQR